MTYRVVQDQPCGVTNGCGLKNDLRPVCYGCNGDGTRMVEVAVVERVEAGPGDVVWVEAE